MKKRMQHERIGAALLASALASACSSETPPLAAPTAPKLVFEPIALGLDRMTDFEFVPGAPEELFATVHTGWLHRVRLRASSGQVLESAEIPGVFYDEGCGLLSLAIDPAYKDNGFLYLGRCDDARTTTLSRYRYDGLASLPQTESIVMRISAGADPPENWHRWGSLGFEDDGETMWALLGDLFVRQNAQDVTSKPGSLLRFRPNRAAGGAGFEPATGNDWADAGAADPSVYAYGFRSPWRGARDRNGRFWVGDVGLVTKEEVNLVTRAGQNFGWDQSEGRCAQNCAGLQDPLIDWGRTSAEPFDTEDPDIVPATKRAGWVGPVYDAPSVDRYYGLFTDRVLYGDFYTGWVRAVKASADGSAVDDRFVGHLPGVVSGRVGPDGYIYLLTHEGVLHRAKQVVD
jgi:hypothetical protein